MFPANRQTQQSPIQTGIVLPPQPVFQNKFPRQSVLWKNRILFMPGFGMVLIKYQFKLRRLSFTTALHLLYHL